MSSDASSSSESSKRGVKRKRHSIPASQKARKVLAAPRPNGEFDLASDSDSDSSDSQSDEKERESLEAQVLSHAAQRKLKRKSQKDEKDTLLSSSSDKLFQDEARSGVTKRQNSIWVGNLAFKSTEQSIRGFFQRGVPRCDVTRVYLPTKTGKDISGGKGMRGENRGFAYVDFATKEAKEQAIRLSEQNLDGRKLLIKDGDDFAGRPPGSVVGSVAGKSKTQQRILSAQKQPPAPTLFFGNLGFQATEDSIRDMIKGHMRSLRKRVSKDNPKEDSKDEKTEEMEDKMWLRKVRLGTFEDSGLCKGWAFVDFVSIDDATMALLDPRNHHLDGRKLVVEYASADAVRRGGGPGAKAHRDKRDAPQDNGGDRRAHARAGVKPQGKPKTGAAEDDLEDQEEPAQKRSRVSEGKEHETQRSRGKRTKPGAALALAKRETVAIVPSKGKKIVF